MDEAIDVANDTEYGLQAGVFTSDYSSAMRCAQEIEAGTMDKKLFFRAILLTILLAASMTVAIGFGSDKILFRQTENLRHGCIQQL